MMPPGKTRKGRQSVAIARMVELLERVCVILDRADSISAALSPAAEAICAIGGYKVASLALLREAGGEVRIEASHGLTPDRAKAGRYMLGEGVAGRVALTGSQIVVPSVAKSPLFLNRAKLLPGGDCSFVCVPLREDRDVVGTLSVERDCAAEAELLDDARLLSMIASMIARTLRQRVAIQTERELLESENRKLRAELTRKYHPSCMVGNSREMQVVYDRVEQAAGSQAAVLIQGEAGTGKELVAKAIHYASSRASQPFVRVHCAALPESLIESELFGHMRGAFTGAVSDRKGRFELADGGTVFLDEIGEIPISIQAKLLRVLRDRELERVGGLKTIKVNVRIIAATHRDIAKMVEQGAFREDLYCGLGAFPIYVPPLRSRKADIQLLAEFFAKRCARTNGRPALLSGEALEALSRYNWPGNVRELEDCIERAALLSGGGAILPRHLPAAAPPSGDEASASSSAASGPAFLPDSPGSLKEKVSAFEKHVIGEELRKTGGNVAAVARNLKSTSRIIGYKIHRLGISQAGR